MSEEKDDRTLETYNNKLFEQYTDKSKHFQRVFTIVVGISVFFFLMILFPYFSLKYEYNSISQFNPLMNNMSKVTTQLDRIINNTQTIQNNIQEFHDTGITWYQDLDNSSRQLDLIEYLKGEFNLTLSNSTLQQNLFERFAGGYGIKCDYEPFGSNAWQDCNYRSIARDYESRTANIVENIRKQIIELVNKTDIQINQLNTTLSNTNSEIQRLHYLSQFGIDTLNLRTFFIDARDNLQTMRTNLLSIDESLEDFSFANFEGYSSDFNLNQEGFGRKLEEAVNILQIAKQSIEQSNNNLVDQKIRINSIAQKIADRLEQPNSPWGILPIGFDELASVFPIALAGGFFICVSSFIDTMNLRKEFHRSYKHLVKNSITDQQIISIAPLWLDPLRPEQNKIMHFAVLIIPFVIFIAGCVLIFYSWTSPNMSIGGEYTNRYIFGGLYLLSGGLFTYGYFKIIKEYHHYIIENASNLGKQHQQQSPIDSSINIMSNNIDNTIAYNTKDVPDDHRLEVEKYSSSRLGATVDNADMSQSTEDFSLSITEKKQYKYNSAVNNLFQRKNLKLFIVILIVAVVGAIIAFAIFNKTTTTLWPQNEASKLYEKGWALHMSGRDEEAITYYDKALTIDPNYKEALYEKGWAFNELGRYEEAIEVIDKVLAIDPNYDLAREIKSLALEKSGQTE
jgi:tetratricopeptide (TPR) repeat protein